jgi:hypothetical protein
MQHHVYLIFINLMAYQPIAPVWRTPPVTVPNSNLAGFLVQSKAAPSSE